MNCAKTQNGANTIGTRGQHTLASFDGFAFSPDGYEQGEMTELVERARLEIECASKGYRGFESPSLRVLNFTRTRVKFFFAHSPPTRSTFGKLEAPFFEINDFLNKKS